MSKLTGPLDLFEKLDELSVSNISRFIHHKADMRSLKNYLGNRILYPQTVAINTQELEIDLAILKESIAKNPEIIYKQSSNQITIPASFISRFPPTNRLLATIIQALNISSQVTEIYVEEGQSRIFSGSVFAPLLTLPIGQSLIMVEINGQPNSIKTGSVGVFPVSDAKIKLKSSLFGEAEVKGGNLGVIIDLRRKA